MCACMCKPTLSVLPEKANWATSVSSLWVASVPRTHSAEQPSVAAARSVATAAPRRPTRRGQRPLLVMWPSSWTAKQKKEERGAISLSDQTRLEVFRPFREFCFFECARLTPFFHHPF